MITIIKVQFNDWSVNLYMRVQLSISDEMVKKLDYYSNKMCMSRSQLMNFLCGQGLMCLDKSMSMLSDVGEASSKILLDNTLKSFDE